MQFLFCYSKNDDFLTKLKYVKKIDIFFLCKLKKSAIGSKFKINF